MSDAITIGCQSGGPDACLISKLKVDLYHLLKLHVTSTHCREIDEYAPVLRVGGSIDKFGEEGLARLRFAKARRYITIDIQIPEKAWRNLNEEDTKSYLAKQVRTAIRACTDRLIKDKCSVDEHLLEEQLEAALSEFTRHAK